MTARNGWTILAAFAVALGLVLGLSFVAKGQGVCMPGMPCYQGPVQAPPQYQGGPCPPVENVESESPLHAEPPQFADVGVSVPAGPNRFAVGSGALVARSANNGTIMLTNNHVMESGTAIVTLSDGRKVQGRVVARDTENDIAAVELPVKLRYAQLTSTDPRGLQVTVRAFDAGVHFRPYEGIVGSGNQLTNAYAVGGNSGSGVYLQGKYIGVLWGNRSNRLAFAGIGPVRRILDRIRARYEVVSVTASSSPQQPTTAPQDCPDCPPRDCGCRSKFAKVHDGLADCVEGQENLVEKFKAILARQDNHEQRIVALEQSVGNFPQKPEPGPQGPAGPPGERGPQGERGPAGKDADTTAINAKIDSLEKELAALRDKKFRVYTHTPYGVFDSEPQGVGEDIHIQYVPAE